MGEVLGAVIATALVLIAVFVPIAFFPGTTGRLYAQFAMTIAFAVALSAFNALTLTPALSALLLDRDAPRQEPVLRVLRAGHRRAAPTATSAFLEARHEAAMGAGRRCSSAFLALTYWRTAGCRGRSCPRKTRATS